MQKGPYNKLWIILAQVFYPLKSEIAKFPNMHVYVNKCVEMLVNN